jgi:penicillin-binding protein 1A
MSLPNRRTRPREKARALGAALHHILLQLEARLRRDGFRLEAFLQKHHPSPRLVIIVVAALLVATIVLWERCGIDGCPDVGRLTAYQPGGASVLLDRNGRTFGDLRPVDRVIVRLNTLPPYVGAAFVAVEDKRFLVHGGVDWRRVVGSAFANIKSGGYAQGFSTITMQLARNVWQDRLPQQERTLRRKLMEVRVAREIEERYTKKEILELYLNHIYFGGGAYGVDAAAVSYFRKRAKDLSIGEAALLAALPKAPTQYDPRHYPQRALARRNLVLGLMAEQGYIRGEDADHARQETMYVAAEPALLRRAPTVGANFIELVRRELEARLGDQLYRAPLRILTTLDVNAQIAAEQELERQLRWIENGALGQFNGARYRGVGQAPEGTDYLQGAVVVLDAFSGDVLALVGGRDFADSRFDRATQARRQVGSAFKPFVYATALGQGIPPTQPILDEPIRVMSNGAPWEPRNYDGQFHGMMSLHDALIHSQNVPTIRLAEAVGLDEIAALARRDGITAQIQNTPMMALGITEVSPLDLASAYTAFASLGRRAVPRTVLSVEDNSGQTLYASDAKHEDVLEPGVAFVLTSILRDAVERGTATEVRNVGYAGLAAGKTGTTNDVADAWFVGYTPTTVGAVWIGFDKRRPIASQATGGHAAAPVWGRMMRRIDATRLHARRWPQPEGVVHHLVDPATGLVLQEGCTLPDGDPEGVWFMTRAVPIEVCPEQALGGGLGGVLTSVWHAVTSIFTKKQDRRSDANAIDQNLGAARLPMSVQPGNATSRR